jgi:hypothetical protein
MECVLPFLCGKVLGIPRHKQAAIDSRPRPDDRVGQPNAKPLPDLDRLGRDLYGQVMDREGGEEFSGIFLFLRSVCASHHFHPGKPRTQSERSVVVVDVVLVVVVAVADEGARGSTRGG